MSNYNHDAFVETGNHCIVQFVVTALLQLQTLTFDIYHYVFTAF